MRIGLLTFNLPFQSWDRRQASAQRRLAHYYLIGTAVIVCFFVVWTSYGTYYDRSVSLSHNIPTLAANTTFCARPNSNSTSAAGWEEIEGDDYPQKGHRPQIGESKRMITLRSLIYVMGSVNRMRKCYIRHYRTKQRVESTSKDSEADGGSIQSRISLSLCIP